MPSSTDTTWIYAERIEASEDLAPGSWIRVDVEGRKLMIQVPASGISREDDGAEDAPYVPTASKATPDRGALLETAPRTEATCNVCGEGAADPALNDVCLECDYAHADGALLECHYCRSGRPATHILTGSSTYPVCARCLPSAMSESESSEPHTIASVRAMLREDRGAWTTAQASAATCYRTLTDDDGNALPDA